ncbi:MAG: DUF1080 domain-containing protein [Gemmataceae bacterium]
MLLYVRIVALTLLVGVLPLLAAEPTAWKDLLADPAATFRQPMGDWKMVGDAKIDPSNPRLLIGTEGKGVFLNGKKGRERDLYTKEKFGDVEVQLEFLLSKGSNSGLKFHGVYEIQICDSYGKPDDQLTGSDNGGIYPRANLTPVYKPIDKGIAPKTNACLGPDKWQKLTAIFVAPRFDAQGNKIANARLVKVTLNGKIIHENQELATPTGHNWTKKETSTGPLMLQGDHGPVAFRNVRVRPYVPAK